MTFRNVLTVACVAALASCGAGPVVVPPDPSGPPFVTTLSTQVTPAALSRCQSTLRSQVRGEVVIVGAAVMGPEHAVYMTVGQGRAPWRCRVSPEGRFPETTFLGAADPI